MYQRSKCVYDDYKSAYKKPVYVCFCICDVVVMGGNLAFIFVMVVPVLVIGLILIILTTWKIFSKIFRKYDTLNNVVQENIKAIRLVKSLVREDFEIEKFDKISSQVKKRILQKAEKIIAFNGPLMQFCLYMDTVLILFFGAYVIINKFDLILMLDNFQLF